MTVPPLDAERLAALLDDRLDERQRAEVLAALGASDEAASVYADAAAVLHDLEGVGAVPIARSAPVETPHVARRGRRLLLAAAAAVVTLTPLVWLQSRASTPDGPAQLVALLDPAPGIRDLPSAPWPVARGALEASSPTAHAVRLGARLFDLQLVATTGDSAAIAMTARDVATLLAQLPASGPAASTYGRIAEGPQVPRAMLASQLREGWDATTRLVGTEAVRFGAWVQAARVAASRRDAEFFSSAASESVLDDTADLSGLTGDAHRALERVRIAVEAEGGPAWGELQSTLEEVLRLAGR